MSLHRVAHLWTTLSASALLILIGAGCGGDDGTGAGSYQAVMKTQGEAEEKLKSLGAKLERMDYPQGSAWSVDLSGKDLPEEVWAALKEVDRISVLNLSGTKISDDQIKNVNEVGGLVIDMDLSKTEVTDAGLAQIESGLLMKLDVSGTKVTAAGVASFQKSRAENPKITIKNVNVKL